MPAALRAQMVLHGVIVFVLGLIAGFPFGQVITGAMQGSERAWRMAHLEGVLNGMLVIAIAGVTPALSLTPRQYSILAWTLIGAGYGNVVASILAALVGDRGLALTDSAGNNLVFLLFVLAIVAVFVGLYLTALGAWRARR